MILNENDKKLESVCRAFELHVKDADALSNLSLEVELLPNFNDLPESSIEAIRDSPAAYRKSSNKIYVNNSTFFSFNEDVQGAFIAHEIGHVVLQNTPSDINIEIKADRLACEWGFFEALRIERLRSYGQKYVDCLAFWEDMLRFNECMAMWDMFRLSGIEQK